jgi:stringent starvation protein B
MDLPAELPSTRPYLIRAMHQWCTDHGFTPHLAVKVGPGVRVPMEHVHDGQIVLNVGMEATQGLELGNDWIAFKARFGGVARDLLVPVDHVLAIYARENGQGMAFPAPAERTESASLEEDDAVEPTGLRLAPEPVKSSDAAPPPDGPAPRPTLKRVK